MRLDPRKLQAQTLADSKNAADAVVGTEKGGNVDLYAYGNAVTQADHAQGSYDAGSAFHVIGNGRLTDELSQQLSDKAKSRLDQMIDEGVPQPR